MKTLFKASALLGCAVLVSGCVEGFEGTQRPSGPAPIVAIGEDRGRDAGRSLSQLKRASTLTPMAATSG